MTAKRHILRANKLANKLPPKKFKVGDKIIIVKDDSCHYIPIGEKSTIAGYDCYDQKDKTHVYMVDHENAEWYVMEDDMAFPKENSFDKLYLTLKC